MKHSKVKNNKIHDWRLELVSLCYTLKYRPSKDSMAPNSFMQVFWLPCQIWLEYIHTALCHPGVTRMLHLVRSKNLPFSTEDVKRTRSMCRMCAELKPQFYCLTCGTLIKATQPMEWPSWLLRAIGSASCNMYMLTIVDEYKRFPFAISLSQQQFINSHQVPWSAIQSCGMTSYINSDRGSFFLLQELSCTLENGN